MSMKNNREKTKQYPNIAICLLTAAIALCSSAKAAREQVEEITSGTYTYRVNMGGTLDEFNTATYPEAPLGGKNVGSKRLESKFQPNKYLIIENTGDVDVINPRIVINGRRDWFSADDILAGILKPGMTDAEKAMAIWTFASSIELQCHENDRRVDAGSSKDNKELNNPVKWANCYYCSGCQFAAVVIAILCQKAGIPAEDTRTVGLGSAHRIAEIRWDGDWHILDGDERMFHLERDNKTLASIEDIGKDPNLCDRTHGGGFASEGLTKKRGVQYRDLQKNITEIKDIEPYLSTMAMTLRPGEKFIWRWDHIGKYRCGDNERNIKPDRPKGLLPYQLANGKMVYQPKLGADTLDHDTFENANIISVSGDNQKPALQPKAAAASAEVIYKISCSYPAVGGLVKAKFFRKTADDICRIYVQVPAHDPNWIAVWSAKDTGSLEESITIDDALNPLPTPAIYNYYVKFELQSKDTPDDVRIDEILIETDVQMSGTALPSLSVGLNNVVYRDQSGQNRQVRITHGWEESSATAAPLPPAAAVSPANGSKPETASLSELAWEPANDPDGSIADYHIQVSPRPDMLYPVSLNFDRITFSQEPKWPIPEGWLRQGQLGSLEQLEQYLELHNYCYPITVAASGLFSWPVAEIGEYALFPAGSLKVRPNCTVFCRVPIDITSNFW